MRVVAVRINSQKFCSRKCNGEWRSSHRVKYSNDLEMRAAHRRKWRARNPLARMAGNLRTNLRQAFKNKGIRKPGCLKWLPYTVMEFQEYMQKLIGLNRCCICRKPLGNDMHIAHLIPSSFAVNLEHLISLFSLENLALAHPSCNIKLRNRPVQ